MEKVFINTLHGIKEVSYMDKNEFDPYHEESEYVMLKGTGTLLYNDFTCLSSYVYGGTCRCINHPPKSWTEIWWEPIKDKKLHRDLILGRRK